MDDDAVDAPPAMGVPEPAVITVDGMEVVAFTAVVERLCAAYPAVPVARVHAVLLREWEAYTAGRPLVIPVAVETGAREILDQA